MHGSSSRLVPFCPSHSWRTANLLPQKMNENCFEKCVPKPGSSISSSEQTCVTQCTEKYMAAWNQVHQAYVARIRQEVGNQSFSTV